MGSQHNLRDAPTWNKSEFKQVQTAWITLNIKVSRISSLMSPRAHSVSLVGGSCLVFVSSPVSLPSHSLGLLPLDMKFSPIVSIKEVMISLVKEKKVLAELKT